MVVMGCRFSGIAGAAQWLDVGNSVVSVLRERNDMVNFQFPSPVAQSTAPLVSTAKLKPLLVRERPIPFRPASGVVDSMDRANFVRIALSPFRFYKSQSGAIFFCPVTLVSPNLIAVLRRVTLHSCQLFLPMLSVIRPSGGSKFLPMGGAIPC